MLDWEDLGQLAQAVRDGQTPSFHPNTGEELDRTGKSAPKSELHPAARMGLDVPRYCQLCGRRMVVQVRPDGWSACCSRHGDLDSAMLDQ